VAGVSSSDDFPPRVRDKPRVGGVQIDYERVAALRPDAVIGVRGLQDDVLARLRRAGHVVIAVDGSSVEGARRSVLLLGALTGRSRAAEAVASAMSGRLAAVRRRVEGAVRPRVFVEVWDQPYLTVGRESLVDDLMTIAGGHNVFADVRGWPQVSEEEIVRRAPEVILVLHADAGRVRARAGWRDVPAVRRARVFRVDESLVTRPGPRLGDGAAEIARRLHPEIPWGPLAR
jgi:iron complex transport system substrate-binding protein